MTPELYDACEKALHVVCVDGTVIRGGAAVIFVYDQLGYSVVKVGNVPPISWGVELGYRVVAKNRLVFSRWFFRN
ncbi:MAG: putative DCC family thiol-disulfide oxidoreductase YuxK [Kiritimatiellia bacterium]|jgi:predicted DCC family thiol-disulfide oxidoreductase YuxK